MNEYLAYLLEEINQSNIGYNLTHASADEQYTALAKYIVERGGWVKNKRTGVDTKTIIDCKLSFDCRDNQISLVSTAETRWEGAWAEFLGYILGSSDSAEFERLGTKTWHANANKNKSWLENEFRKGENDMGDVYGAVGNNWPKFYKHAADASLEFQGETIDLLKKVYNNLKNGIDDRGEIWMFWNPGLFEFGCLRPCVYSHQFSLLGDTLYLTSTQRSCDVPLGLKYNIVQVQAFLILMAKLTGHKPGFAHLNIVNTHIYENQLDIMVNEQLPRGYESQHCTFEIDDNIQSLEQLREILRTDDKVLDRFRISGYEPQPFIRYPFTE